MTHSFAAEADREYERLVARLIATARPRLALLNHAGDEQHPLMQKILEDSAIRAHFSDRCVSVSCDGATNTQVAIGCLASGLGLSPNEGIEAIHSHLVAQDHTLVVIQNVDAIYSPADPEQQEATDVLLTTLAALDDITLVITFYGTPLPECVAWTVMNGDMSVAFKLTVPLRNGLQTSTKQTLVPTRPGGKAEEKGSPPAFEASHAATLSDILVSSHFATVANTFVRTSSHDYNYKAPQVSTRPLTLAQSKAIPARPTVFHGRHKELELLVSKAMVQSTAPIAIIGPGGIGKTTLAMNVLHDPRIKQHFGRERFFLTCDGANSPEEVLAHLASKLDVERSQNEALWPAVLDNLRSRQRVLILLDNFESIWSPTDHELRVTSEVFLAQLAVVGELTLLVTTRGNRLPESSTWANVDTAELDTLSSTAARQTFNDLTCLKPQILESGPEANALTELLREIDFMPLAITLLARLDDLPSRLLREWSEHYTAMLETDDHDGSRRELSVAVSIQISLAHLPAESADVRPRQLLSVMGQLPAGLFQGVSTQLHQTVPNLDLAAQHLLRHSLVYTGSCGELRMFSPVRHYVSACLPMSAETLIAVDEVYIGLIGTRPRVERTHIDGPAYDVELPNLLNIFALALDRRNDLMLVCAILQLAGYCGTRSQSCLQLLQKLAPHIRRNRWMRAVFLQTISVHYHLTGEPDLAAQSAEQSAELYRDVKDKLGEAASRELLSICFKVLGRFEDMDREEARCLALRRESTSPDISYLAPPAPGVDLMLAEQHLRDDRDVCLQAGNGLAVTRLSDHILKIVFDRGGATAYVEELKLTFALRDRPGMQSSAWPHWYATVNSRLATEYIVLGALDAAEDLLVDAYGLMLSPPFNHGLAMVVRSFAILRGDQGHFNEGVELAEAAGKLYRKVGDMVNAALCDQDRKKMQMGKYILKIWNR